MINMQSSHSISSHHIKERGFAPFASLHFPLYASPLLLLSSLFRPRPPTTCPTFGCALPVGSAEAPHQHTEGQPEVRLERKGTHE